MTTHVVVAAALWRLAVLVLVPGRERGREVERERKRGRGGERERRREGDEERGR
jgi:hypothetical protein